MIPEGMETLVLPAGLYAVFIHKGPASTGPATYQYIFETWLPGADCGTGSTASFCSNGRKIPTG
jgi:AraC family transcriptional regulator